MSESVGYLDHGVGALDPEHSSNRWFFGDYEDKEGDPDAAYDDYRERELYND